MFCFVFGLFQSVSKQFCFSFFVPILKQRISMFRLNRNKQKTNRNSLIERLFWYFQIIYGCFGLFRNSSVCLSCFDLSSKHRNKPKQTKIFGFWFWVSRNKPKFLVFGFEFHETNQNTTKTDLVSVCFGSNRTEIFFFLFGGHPMQNSRKARQYRVSFSSSPVKITLPSLFSSLAILGISLAPGDTRLGIGRGAEGADQHVLQSKIHTSFCILLYCRSPDLDIIISDKAILKILKPH